MPIRSANTWTSAATARKCGRSTIPSDRGASPGEPERRFVSRGGHKLAAALDAFALDVGGLRCADLGAHVGGFTDCLLQRGAATIYAVDTAYGELAWKLRQDPRVVVLERTNALYMEERRGAVEAVDMVTVDLGWTRQERAIPAALLWSPKWIVTLIKPHYEISPERGRSRRGVLDEPQARNVVERVLEQMPELGVEVLGHIRSPIRGGGGKKRRGNVEYPALLKPLGHA